MLFSSSVLKQFYFRFSYSQFFFWLGKVIFVYELSNFFFLHLYCVRAGSSWSAVNTIFVLKKCNARRMNK